MRRSWLVVALVAACSSRPPAGAAPRPSGAGDARADAAAVAPADAAVALDAAPHAVAVDASPRVAGDPPEPTAPAAECAFDRSVFCEDGVPTRTALQPAPFEWCHPTRPARQPSLYRTDARFSAAETRAARATAPDACCYVEFTTMACE